MNMKTVLKNMNEEERTTFTDWLNEKDTGSHGHSVTGIDGFVEAGFPRAWLEPMVDRRWSNFVQVPKGITKLANDTVTHLPIGWLEKSERWVFLVPPKDQEAGYLDNNFGYWTKDRVKDVWVSLSDYAAWNDSDQDEYDIESMDELHKQIMKQHDVHPDAEYWGHQMMSENDCRNWGYEYPGVKFEFKIPVRPSMNGYGEKYQEYEVTSNPYYIKYDGTKRTEFVHIKRYTYFLMKSEEELDSLEDKVAFVKSQREESPGTGRLVYLFGGPYGDIHWQEDGEDRPAEDVAKDLLAADEEERASYGRAVDRMRQQIPDIDDYIRFNEDRTRYGYDDKAPLGWTIENLNPMGYADVMWNSNYMQPWVDGIGNATVISALAKEVGGDTSNVVSIGRGFAGRELAAIALKAIEENMWFADYNEEEE